MQQKLCSSEPGCHPTLTRAKLRERFRGEAMAIQPVACRGRGVEKAGLGVRKRVHGESLSLRIREPARGAHRHRATEKKKVEREMLSLLN